MNKKTIIGIIIIVLVIGGVWYFASQKEGVKPLETTKIKIGGLPITQGLPLFLALEKGYFKEEGLDVEWIRFEDPTQLLNAILTGEIDFTHTGGPMSIAAIADFKNPNKLKIFEAAGGDNAIPNDSLMVRNDSSIKSIQDLRGKKLGVLAGIQWRTIARHILAQNNLVAEQDVTLIELAPALQAPALASGQIDALLAIEPMPTIVKEKGIGKEIVHTPTALYVSNPFLGGAGIMNLDFAKQNPETTKKVLKVFAKAIMEINENPDAARQYQKNYTSIEENLISLVPIPLFKMYNDLTQNDINAVQKFLDIFSTYKIVDGKMDFQKLLYSPISL